MSFVRQNWSNLFKRAAGRSVKQQGRSVLVPSTAVEQSATDEELEEVTVTAPPKDGTANLPHQNIIDGTLEIVGYVEGTHFTVNHPAGSITNLSIPAGTVLSASYYHEDDGYAGMHIMRDGDPLPVRDYLNLIGDMFSVDYDEDSVNVSVLGEKAGPVQHPAVDPMVTVEEPIGYYVKGERVWLEGIGTALADQVVCTLPVWVRPERLVRLRTVEVRITGEMVARGGAIELDGESFRIGGHDALYPSEDLYPSEELYPYG